MELFASILIDIGFLCIFVGACFSFFIHCKIIELCIELPFFKFFFIVETIAYWNEFPDLKHRLLVIMVYVLPISGLILVTIGGCLGGSPLVLLYSGV